MKKTALLFLLSTTLIAARPKPIPTPLPEESRPCLDEIHEEYVRLILEEQHYKTALKAAAIPTMAGIIVAGAMVYYLNK